MQFLRTVATLYLAHLTLAAVDLEVISESFNTATPSFDAQSAISIKTSVGVATSVPSGTTDRDLVRAFLPKPFLTQAAGRNAATAFISKGKSLAASLSQAKTNGNSVWGTSSAPQLAAFLDGPMQNGKPWGSANSKTTNYYNTMPNTGVTRRYTFNVGRATIAPDGVEKDAIVINGAFPGPLIEANWGDWISVTVNNQLEDEGTSLHWHGLLQKETPEYDGVPGVQQCPIAPGKSFTYRGYIWMLLLPC